MPGGTDDAVVAANGDVCVPADSAGLFVLCFTLDLDERIRLPPIVR